MKISQSTFCTVIKGKKHAKIKNRFKFELLNQSIERLSQISEVINAVIAFLSLNHTMWYNVKSIVSVMMLLYNKNKVQKKPLDPLTPTFSNVYMVSNSQDVCIDIHPAYAHCISMYYICQSVL